MKQSILKLISVFAIFAAFGVLQKALFMAAYSKVIGTLTPPDIIDVIWHGLPMDCSIAGYLTVIPAILITVSLWVKGRWPESVLKIWLALASTVLAAVTCVDLALYGYWGFRLDMTPLFYLTTSPQAAMASASWWQMLGGVTGTALLAVLLYQVFRLTALRIHVTRDVRRPWASTAVMLLLTALLIIPIRGGLTVSTMNLSRAYFSENTRLNHAAINPAFSLMYSATHQTDFDNEYRVMTDGEAAEALARLNEAAKACGAADSIAAEHNIRAQRPLLKDKRPDIYLIILESFSAHLMPSLGGEDIAPCLDSIASSGILFTNFYANSFRTDRALPAILSGFPSQPSMSLMKYVEKAEHLPSLSATLRDAGYSTAYYYGGDINFTNMNAYLVNSGFETIVCDKDFPLAERTGKWGAHDHLVFSRALADAAKMGTTAAPRLNVIQTSSSHEPFEVPYTSTRFKGEPQKNAFAYTDSCLRSFVKSLKALPRYDRSLIVIVPDHLGAWPLDLPDAFARHHVPLVLAGGALDRGAERITTAGSQIDIAATLLRQLGLDSSEFRFSKDLFDASTPHFALITESSLIGIATPCDTVVWNCDASAVEKTVGDSSGILLNGSKAYLQTLYHSISEL